eukprot:7309058-Prymnesium_polylepis.1
MHVMRRVAHESMKKRPSNQLTRLSGCGLSEVHRSKGCPLSTFRAWGGNLLDERGVTLATLPPSESAVFGVLSNLWTAL